MPPLGAAFLLLAQEVTGRIPAERRKGVLMATKHAYTIALAGKGGTGKTTVAGLLVRFLKEHGMTPVLAVDADANANLNEVLGLAVHDTLGEARETMKKDVPTGMTKDLYIEMKVQQALVEAEGFDLIVMGRPEGPGCYCAANSLLSKFIESLIRNYEYLVIDNEAGMEHLSRLTTRDIDLLLVVSDPSRRGIQAARRIHDLVDELGIRVGRKFLLVNQYREGLPPLIAEEMGSFGLDSVATIPEDELIHQYDLQGRPTTHLPLESKALQAANAVFTKLLM
jgi:CO dehydrogenase maturation factor